jgi:hypothetical protein
VNKALALNALAANVARGRNISLEAAQQIVLKASLGQAGALRRVGIAVGKHATALQLIDALSKKYGKSAEAYGRTAAGAQDRFGVAIQNTQEAIGAGLLPTITEYLNKGSAWLSQTENQERIQRDVTEAVKTSASVIKDLASVVKTAADAVGGFKHLAEILIGLKLGAVFLRWAKAARELRNALIALNTASILSSFGSTAATSAGPVARLLGYLRRIGRIGVLSVAFRFPGLAKFLPFLRLFGGAVGTALTVLGLHGDTPDGPGFSKEGDAFTASRLARQGKIPTSVLTAGARAVGLDPNTRADKAFANPQFVALVLAWAKSRGLVTPGVSAGGNAAEALAKAAHGLGLKLNESAADAVKKSGLNLTAAQRNTFFDNTIGRILLRGGLGNIKQQLAAIRQAAALITQRMAKTKDITRKLNLEDQLLQLQAQATDLRKQAADDLKQKSRDAAQALIDALQFGVTKAQATASFTDDLAALGALQAGIKNRLAAEGKTLDLQQQLFDVQQQIKQARTDQLTSKQFRRLGLTASGDEVTPGVANLKKRLASITTAVSGSFLDTKKMETQLARFRKVLFNKLTPPTQEVRAKIKEMLDGISQQLKDHAGNQTKFRHLSSAAFVQGITGLSPDQVRQLRSRFVQVSAGGTVPGSRSPAFALAGGNAVTEITVPVTLDGHTLATVTHKHISSRRSQGRRG